MRALGLLLLAGCGSAEPLFLPANPQAAATLLVVESGDAVSVTAFDADGAGAQIVPDLDTNLVASVLWYQMDLPALELVAGRVTLPEGDAPSRPLPDFAQAQQAVIDAGTTSGFQTLSAPTPALQRVRLPWVDPTACVAQGGCWAESADRCVTPCPTPAEPMAPAPATLPAAAKPPTLTPCPLGWTTETEAGYAACAPPAPQTCGPGTWQAPGAATCAPLGTTCGPDGWPQDAPANALFVRPGASGNGRRDNPFGTVLEAAAQAPTGGTLVLARGSHPGGRLTRAVTLHGCADAQIAPLILEAPTMILNLQTSALTVRAATTLNNVAVRAGPLALEVTSATVTAQRIAIHAEALWVLENGGLVLQDASLRPSRSAGRVVRSRLQATDLSLAGPATGIEVSRSFVDLVRADLHTLDGALRLTDSQTRLDDVVFRSGSGRPLSVDSGTLSGRRVLVRDAQGTAIQLASDSQLYLTDALISEVSLAEDIGHGLVVGGQSTARAIRLAIHRAARIALVTASTASTSLSVDDLIVRATRPRSNGEQGVAVELGGDGGAVLRRVLLESNQGTALHLRLAQRVNIEDLRIHATLPEADQTDGSGILVEQVARFELTRARLTDNHAAAMYVLSTGVHELSDLTISGTRWNGDEALPATGILLQKGRTTLRRVHLFDNSGRGIWMQETARANLEDVRIERSSLAGLRVGETARADGQRIAIRATAGQGLVLNGQSQAILTNLSISELENQSDRAAMAINLREDSALELSSFALANNGTFGLFLGDQASGRLQHGSITQHEIAMSLPETYDLKALVRGVLFRDNAQDLQGGR